MERRSILGTAAVFVVTILAGASIVMTASVGQHTPAIATLPPIAEVAATQDRAPDLIEAVAEDLAWAGRDTLSYLQGLDQSSMRDAIDRGDAAVTTLTAELALLPANDPERPSVAALPGIWQGIKTRALADAAVFADLQRHNQAAINAAGYTRQKAWSQALASLGDAAAAMSAARSDATALGPIATLPTLGDLFNRYDAYDAALRSFAVYRSTGHGQRSRMFVPLQEAVTTAQAALPGGYGTFSVIVGEGGGTSLMASLAEIDQARTAIDAEDNPPLRHAQ